MQIEAVFLDRDGTLNVERADYVKSHAEFVLLPGALAALRQLSLLGIPVIVVTNQSAIGRGLVARATVDAIHAYLADLCRHSGGRIDAFYICPHRPDEACGCRKPRPGLFYQAADDFGLDLRRCVFVGDSVSDWQAAQAACCRPILVRTGRQGAQLADLLTQHNASLPLVDDIGAAAGWIQQNCVVNELALADCVPL